MALLAAVAGCDAAGQGRSAALASNRWRLDWPDVARSLRRLLRVAQADAALAVGAVQVKAARVTRTRSKPAKKKAKEEAPLPPEEPLYEPRLPE